ncbi:MAG: hypothetical protein AAGC81_10925 [Pseudomonadota bacterium]
MPITVDEMAYRLRNALKSGRLKDWETGFVLGFLKGARDANWYPTTKQKAVVDRILLEAAYQNMSVIEED